MTSSAPAAIDATYTARPGPAQSGAPLHTTKSNRPNSTIKPPTPSPRSSAPTIGAPNSAGPQVSSGIAADDSAVSPIATGGAIASPVSRTKSKLPATG